MTFRPLPLRVLAAALDFGSVGGVMAILNVTPDSFSDGGRLATPGSAVKAGLRFADAGAAILDVGGESTRPRGASYGKGAGEVTVDDELARCSPSSKESVPPTVRFRSRSTRGDSTSRAGHSKPGPTS